MDGRVPWAGSGPGVTSEAEAAEPEPASKGSIYVELGSASSAWLSNQSRGASHCVRFRIQQSSKTCGGVPDSAAPPLTCLAVRTGDRMQGSSQSSGQRAASGPHREAYSEAMPLCDCAANAADSAAR